MWTYQDHYKNAGYQLKTGQFKAKPFVVSPSASLRRALSNHERLNLKTAVHHRDAENTEQNHRDGNKIPSPIGYVTNES